MRKAILHLKKSDPALAGVIQKVGPYRIEFREPGFDTLVRSIVYQQLSGKVAFVILERLRSAVPRGILTPKAILRLTPEQMRARGLSAQKTAYIRDLAERTLSGEVNFKRVVDLTDEDVVEHLTRVKGIGVWTAHMFLIFALRRPNVLPVGDLGVRAAIRKIYGLEKLPTPQEVAQYAERWAPYCSVATWYLWRSLETPAQI
jgi:DNA-3-methyladenine glycosylase II